MGSQRGSRTTARTLFPPAGDIDRARKRVHGKVGRLRQPVCGRQGADRIARPDGHHQGRRPPTAASLIQGHGTFGAHECEAASMLRYGQMSADEFFVSEKAAKEGVVISNHSKVEPLVILKHFAPNNKEIPQKSPLWED